MLLHLLSLTIAMSALLRVDDASAGGAVVALNSTTDDRPVWHDGRLTLAVAAADGDLVELAQPPQTTTLALTTARDGQAWIDVAVVAAARPTTDGAVVLAVACVAVAPSPRGSVLVVASVRFRGSKVIIRAHVAADAGARATAVSVPGLSLPDQLPRPWRADVGGPHARVLIGETVLSLDQRAPGGDAAPLSATGDVEPAFTASRVWPASAELALHLADAVRGRSVIELGAGAGLSGLACAVLGASRVVLTDLPENLALLERNAARNELDVAVAALDWMAPHTLGKFDVVIAADCVFLCENQPVSQVIPELLPRTTSRRWRGAPQISVPHRCVLARAVRSAAGRHRGGRGARGGRLHRCDAPAGADRSLLRCAPPPRLDGIGAPPPTRRAAKHGRVRD